MNINIGGNMGYPAQPGDYTNMAFWDPRSCYPKPLPPYGQSVMTLLEANQRPTGGIWLFSGADAWRKAKNFRRREFVLILPENTSPRDFYWPVQQCEILWAETSEQPAELLSEMHDCLCDHGALSICLIRYNYKVHCWRMV